MSSIKVDLRIMKSKTVNSRDILLYFFSGLTQITGWIQVSNSLYFAKVNFTSVQNVFVNHQKITWGRTPNLDQPVQSRYFTIEDATSTSVSTTQINGWNNFYLFIFILYCFVFIMFYLFLVKFFIYFLVIFTN